MVKFIFFIIQIFLLLFVVAFLFTNSFNVIFEIKELNYAFSSNLLLFCLLVILLSIFLIQLLYFKSRYKLQKYFLSKQLKNYQKGYNFFTESMIALASKDNKGAINAKIKMNKYLKNNQGLSLILDSEILKIEKKNDKLELLYQQMIKEKNTQILGYKGLMELNLMKQDYHHAFIYAERLFELNPYIEKIYPSIINIIARTKNWNQLIAVTNKAYNKKIIDKKTFNTNTSIAYYEISKIKIQSDSNESLKLIIKALKLNKSFSPFIKTHLDILFYTNQLSNITNILRKYWNESPSSSLRHVISAFLKKVKISDVDNIMSIIKNNKQKPESKKLLLDFAIYNSNWQIARESIIGMIDNNPDREICELMASLELGESNDKQKSDAWHLRAQNANLNKIWVCSVTNTTQTDWESISQSGYFNSLEWKLPKMLSANQ